LKAIEDLRIKCVLKNDIDFNLKIEIVPKLRDLTFPSSNPPVFVRGLFGEKF